MGRYVSKCIDIKSNSTREKHSCKLKKLGTGNACSSLSCNSKSCANWQSANAFYAYASIKLSKHRSVVRGQTHYSNAFSSPPSMIAKYLRKIDLPYTRNTRSYLFPCMCPCVAQLFCNFSQPFREPRFLCNVSASQFDVNNVPERASPWTPPLSSIDRIGWGVPCGVCAHH